MGQPVTTGSIHQLSSSVFRRHVALPAEHGAWVFLFSPLLIGFFAAGRWTWTSVYLLVAVVAVFLIRQPVIIAIKVYSRRRNRRDLPAAWFWIAVYGLIALVGLAGLAAAGYGYLLLLAIPGLPVFAWYLYLVNQRAERRQAGVEIVGSGVFALAAPAAYWVGTGSLDPTGWWLFALTWFQSAASIVYAYLRLAQRELPAIPTVRIRFALGWRPLLYTTFNFIAVSALAVAGRLPVFLPLPYAVQLAETFWGILHPAIGEKPTRIGVRQLIVSIIFTILFILAWL